jgi:anaphase-promoting complex subunit 6
LLFLKGQVCDALEKRDLAAKCYKQALLTDVHCYEALETLVQQQMLCAVEGKKLMTLLFQMMFKFCGTRCMAERM